MKYFITVLNTVTSSLIILSFLSMRNSFLMSTNCDEIINQEDFEAGWGIWVDDGNDAARVRNATYAHSGKYSIRLADDVIGSSTTTLTMDMTAYTEVVIDFTYYPLGNDEVGDEFFLEVTTDGGATFDIIRSWAYGLDFDNNLHYTESVSVPQSLSDQTKFRFRAHTTNNLDRIWIDDITISGCLSDGEPEGPETNFNCTSHNEEDFEQGFGIWLVDGGDAARVKNSSFANSGNFSIRLRDDTETSSFTSMPLDFSGYSAIQVDFSYYPIGNDEASDQFILELSTDQGNSFTQIRSWNFGDEFNNETRYNVSVSHVFIGQPGTVLRFRSQTTNDNDRIWIDDIHVKTCHNTKEIQDIKVILPSSADVCDASIRISLPESAGPYDIILNGGDPPITQVLSDVNGDVEITDLCMGQYNLSLINVYGCIKSTSLDLSPCTYMIDIAATVNQISCEYRDGSISTEVSNGTPPYDYLWSDGVRTSNRTFLGPGTYDLLVTDSECCQSNATYIIIDQEPYEFMTPTIEIHPSCQSGSNGSISVLFEDDLLYQWDHGPTTSSISDLSPGLYYLSVTKEDRGCTLDLSFEIDNFDADIELVSLIEECEGYGSIDITINSSSPYTISWDGPPGPISNYSEDIAGLPDGTYIITVHSIQDINCQVQQSYIIASISSEIVVDGDVSQSTNCSSDDIGMVDVSVSGGTPPYSYQWDHGPETEDLSDLYFGIYTLKVTDINGCQSIGIFETQPVPSQIFIGATIKNTCADEFSGAIDVNISGGTPPYSIEWENGFGNEEDLENLTDGLYAIAITDARGCQKRREFRIQREPSVGVTIVPGGTQDNDCMNILTLDATGIGSFDVLVEEESLGFMATLGNLIETYIIDNICPGQYVVTTTNVSTGCIEDQLIEVVAMCEEITASVVNMVMPSDCDANDGGISIRGNIRGGTDPYMFKWFDSDNNEIAPGSTSSLWVSNLSSGHYFFQITDANNCVQRIEYILRATNEPDLFVTMNESCDAMDNGFILIEAVNVNDPGMNFDFHWDNGESFIDMEYSKITNLSSGTYCVDISATGTNDCMITECYEVISNVVAEDLIIEADIKSSCPGGGLSFNSGRIDVSVLNGVPPYSFDWSDTDVFNGSTRVFLTPGNYTVTVTDHCDVSTTKTFEMKGVSIEVDLVYGCEGCAGASEGQYTIRVLNGQPPYYMQVNGGPWESFSEEIAIKTIENPFSGQHIIRISDRSNCFVTHSFEYRNREIEVVELINPCEGLQDGIAIFNIYNPENENVEVNLNNMAIDRTFNQFKNELVIPQLRGKIEHILDVNIGGCIYQYAFTLLEDCLERVYNTNEDGTCYYDLYCKGDLVVERGFTSNERYDHDNVDGCKAPVYCENYEGVDDIRVGDKQFSNTRVKVFEYIAILNAAFSTGLFSSDVLGLKLQYIQGRGLNDCAHVRYCEADLSIFSTSSTFTGGNESPMTDGHGCWYKNCHWPTGDINFCIEDIVPDYMLASVELFNNPFQGLYVCDEFREINLYQLIVWNSAMLDAYPSLYPGSELNNLAIIYENDPQAKCAKVRYCRENFNVYSYDVERVSCNISPNGWDCTLTYIDNPNGIDYYQCAYTFCHVETYDGLTPPDPCLQGIYREFKPEFID